MLALLRTTGDCAPHASPGTSLLGSSHVTTDAVAPANIRESWNATEPLEPEQERRRTILMLIRADRFLKNRAAENADWKRSVGHRSGIASVAVKRKSGITRVPLGLAGSYSVFLWTFTTPFRWERSLWLFLAKSSLPSFSSAVLCATLQVLCCS